MVTFQMQCFSWSQNQPFARIFGIIIAKGNYIMHIIGKISNMQNHIICSSLSFSLQCWQGDSIFISHVSIDCKTRRPRFCYWRKGFEPEQIRPSAVASNSVIWKKDILKSKTLLQALRLYAHLFHDPNPFSHCSPFSFWTPCNLQITEYH